MSRSRACFLGHVNHVVFSPNRTPPPIRETAVRPMNAAGRVCIEDSKFRTAERPRSKGAPPNANWPQPARAQIDLHPFARQHQAQSPKRRDDGGHAKQPKINACSSIHGLKSTW